MIIKAEVIINDDLLTKLVSAIENNHNELPEIFNKLLESIDSTVKFQISERIIDHLAEALKSRGVTKDQMGS